ncbi:MAG: M28 family peptidase, partial [Candidatus Latescibacterota bacterium]
GRAPRRTLAFVLFAAEEQGLLGSLAFVQDPPLELDSVIAMLNLDVEGHGNGKVGIGGGDFFPDAWRDFRASLGEVVAESLVEGRPWGSESSDHAPFRNAGIPAMSIWSEGEHRFYHRIDDDPEWVTEAVLGSVGRMTERWVRALSDREGPLLAPHREGRSMLYGADQIDFDGTTSAGAPPYVRGSVRWVDAVAEGEDFLRAAGDLRVRADAGDSLSVVAALGEMRGASRGGRKAVLLGIRAGAAPLAPETEALLREVGVGIAALGPVTSETAPGDSGRLRNFTHEGIVFLAPPDLTVAAALPKGAKCLVRFRMGRGEEIAEPDSLPRGAFLFVATLGGPVDPEGVARALERLGTDRVHLDLVPWAFAGGGPSAGSGEGPGASGGGGLAEREAEIAAFLEELRRAGRFEPHETRALLGGNLARF